MPPAAFTFDVAALTGRDACQVRNQFANDIVYGTVTIATTATRILETRY